MIDDERFKDVQLNTNEVSACSPEDPDQFWEGMAINVPARVVLEPTDLPAVFEALEPIPICGFYRLEMAGLGVGDELVVTAKNTETGFTWSGGGGENDLSPDEPPPDLPPLDNAMFEGVLTSDYFNINMTEALDLPAVPATYEIHVDFGKFQSNKVTIEIARPEK